VEGTSVLGDYEWSAILRILDKSVKCSCTEKLFTWRETTAWQTTHWENQ